MGFFERLKERLLTLEEVPKKIKKDENVKSSDNSSFSENEKTLEKKLKKEKKLEKYVNGFSKSNSFFSRKIREIQTRHNKINEEFFEELEEVLILSDISVPVVSEMIEEIKKETRIQNVTDPKLISEIVVDKLFNFYADKNFINQKLNIEDGRINTILMVGVNGVGKTTTIAKIANKYIFEGKKVLIAAADTFRAGAVEQLDIWSKRIGASIVKPIKENADPASVVFDAVKKAKEEKFDILIIDTAGRLQNKVNLMNELKKISKIISNEIPNAPHESFLVLDATTGQNGVLQAQSFKDVTPLSGIVLTKMDGTSKGGIIFTIKDQLNLSVKLIGLGEQLDDLQEFDLDAFIYSLTKDLILEEN